MTCQQVTGGGFKCEANKPITFNSPLDPTNPLVSHEWDIDGVLESTSASFQKTYNDAGLHTVVHNGLNACGAACTRTAQLEIAPSITPPQTSSVAPKSPLGIVVVALGTIAVVGLLISQSGK